MLMSMRAIALYSSSILPPAVIALAAAFEATVRESDEFGLCSGLGGALQGRQGEAFRQAPDIRTAVDSNDLHVRTSVW